MILNAARRIATISSLFFALLFATAASGAELRDGMALFFAGDYQDAHLALSSMISEGHRDARIHYYRGLANQRLGNAQAAAVDFQTGAKLEVSAASYGVGEALQRIQGLERLQLERYRTMARLTSRVRRQPIAPKPIPTTGTIQLASVDMPLSAPLFRLASEIPIRSGGSASNGSDMLASEKMPVGPAVPPSAGKEKAVGTGVATTPADANFDPFADDADQPKSGGVIGAVLNALGGNSGAADSTTQAEAEPQADETSEDATLEEVVDESDDPFGFDGESTDEEDPFGDL